MKVGHRLYYTHPSDRDGREEGGREGVRERGSEMGGGVKLPFLTGWLKCSPVRWVGTLPGTSKGAIIRRFPCKFRST